MDSMLYSSSFVNRDEPIPVLRVPAAEQDPLEPSSSDAPKTSKREAIKHHADRIKEKFDGVREEYKQGGAAGLQERLLNSLMAQMIPPEEGVDGEIVKDRRSSEYVDRPSFSLPLMSYNFRRFNARVGVVFVLQNELIRLFTWRQTTHTLSFLAVYTLICLRPSLLPSIPLALIFFFVMIPSFLARHPPPPSSSSTLTPRNTWEYNDYSHRPVAPPTHIRPAPEMSKDFFRNMRDLQNSMEDFARIHDGAIATIQPYTDFSDEKVSSFVFLAIFTLLVLATITSHLLPFRLIALLAGWGATCAGHPSSQTILLSTTSLSQISEFQSRVATILSNWIQNDIALDAPAEVREVEIYEFQRLCTPYTSVASHTPSSSPPRPTSSFASGKEEYEPWLFSPQPWTPLSPLRVAGSTRPSGTQFFDEVAAPRGWVWRDKKWALDLASANWVEERCVTGVEVETEGERWVYDLLPNSGPGKSWEEGTGASKGGRRGEWRRRRWVRAVERRVVKVPEE